MILMMIVNRSLMLAIVVVLQRKCRVLMMIVKRSLLLVWLDSKEIFRVSSCSGTVKEM